MNTKPDMPPVPSWIIDNFHSLLADLQQVNDRIDKLRLIYDFVDTYNKYVVTPYAVCAPGCADCCRVVVEITPLEADYIAHHTGLSYNSKRKPEWESGEYCPLLDRGHMKCSVYDYRPFHCRTFHSMDSAEYCWPPNQKHFIFGSPVEGYGSNLLMILAMNIVGLNGGTDSMNLHDIFRGYYD